MHHPKFMMGLSLKVSILAVRGLKSFCSHSVPNRVWAVCSGSILQPALVYISQYICCILELGDCVSHIGLMCIPDVELGCILHTVTADI